MRKPTIATLSAPTALAAGGRRPAAGGRGAFCIYSGPDQTGSLLVVSQGNWSGSVCGRSVLDNGRSARVYP
ncbi:peptidase inhibitor family I36 protein [Streptomyces sp. SP17KL33]|uniref:peptidase inhibitor family I36 protein n=1 Tax=Streptomyces sp. SP17KL33 TaxID=3002534 RepID=UPI002E788D81|nr:peptidase inhibitor family I36 protein [Streptomyces sp. SP17KL33]MEE1835735.1 peptidase inhibitor family I36 protein [Streptomyces sp. SP17KL33]